MQCWPGNHHGMSCNKHVSSTGGMAIKWNSPFSYIYAIFMLSTFHVNTHRFGVLCILCSDIHIIVVLAHHNWRIKWEYVTTNYNTNRYCKNVYSTLLRGNISKQISVFFSVCHSRI